MWLAALLAVPALAAELHVQVRDPAGRGVADAVIYAMPASGPSEARLGKTAAVEQIDREFVPTVTVIQTGTAVVFPNRDPILHHVYSFSAAKTFEIKLYTGKSPREIVFDKPGVVTLGCNIHDWMLAFIAVVSTPHFGKTDASGKARLRDLPPGAYDLFAWHPNQRSAPQPIKIAVDGADNIASFVIETVATKTRYKPPLDRMRY